MHFSTAYFFTILLSVLVIMIQTSAASNVPAWHHTNLKPLWARGEKSGQGQQDSTKPGNNMINFPGQEGKPECRAGEKVSPHDCNRALLALGPGIKGKIKFLRVDTDTATGVFGTCKVTVQSLDKRPVHVSKGRLEHGPGYEAFMKECNGQAGTIILGGGLFGMTIESLGRAGSDIPK